LYTVIKQSTIEKKTIEIFPCFRFVANVRNRKKNTKSSEYLIPDTRFKRDLTLQSAFSSTKNPHPLEILFKLRCACIYRRETMKLRQDAQM